MWPLLIALTVLVVIPSLALCLIAIRLSRKGFAPGWQARCSVCGTVIPAGEIPGVIRIHTHRDFKSVAKHTCETCGEVQSFDIEYDQKS